MTYKPVEGHDKYRQELLNDPEAFALYEANKLQIELAIALKNARNEKKMTQEEVANKMQTHKPVVSRLEKNTSVAHFPSLLTIVKFAAAVGCELKIILVPIRYKGKKKKIIEE